MIELLERYQRRPIRFLELWQDSGWRMKVYSITHQGAPPRPELVQAAKQVAQRWLRQPPTPNQRTYGVGFLGIHDGHGANFVCVDWWADENELQHHVYLSPTDRPAELRYVSPTGLAASVWDLRVLCFERQAWIDTVLANPIGPDLDAYLSRRLNEDV
jgi:hypothetical protein